MTDDKAYALATRLLESFVEHQEIPPGGTTGTAESHGRKTAEFLAALHQGLYDYFRKDGTGA